jgi:hypothetical protein
MRAILEWATTQFQELGCAEADDLAVALLAATLRDPELLSTQVRRPHDGIDTVGARATA